MKLCSRIALLCALTVTTAQAQTATPPLAASEHPSFEVATIKPASPDNKPQSMGFEGSRVKIQDTSLSILVMFAYNIHPKQIVDAPSWMEDKYDIEGVADIKGEPNFTQFREMLRKLLEDRFALKVHHEQREIPVYTLTVTKGGSKLQPSKPDSDGKYQQYINGGAQGLTMKWANASLADFALTMNFFLERPAVDRTGLNGKYDITLQCQPKIKATPNPTDYPDLFTAIPEQLGLKLNAVKDKADVLVIDHLEHPSAN